MSGSREFTFSCDRSITVSPMRCASSILSWQRRRPGKYPNVLDSRKITFYMKHVRMTFGILESVTTLMDHGYKEDALSHRYDIEIDLFHISFSVFIHI